jgi:cell fate regulator YaaT (PSP1 superfamily)
MSKEPKKPFYDVVGVRFRDGGKIYYFDPNGIDCNQNDHVIVETARGLEFATVTMSLRTVKGSEVVLPLRKLVRIATENDERRHEDNLAKETEAFNTCLSKIETHRLEMKLVDVEYAFDNSKLLFYFTSEGRVDFRELVHDLASHFHTRIELRQIGIRDESRLIGGLGMCGRPFCCSTFLSDFGQVSVKMAKEQGLSINASKISGCCGRLMCCLRYEHETYVAESKLTPKKDTVVITPDGKGTVVDNSPLAGTVRVRLDATPEEAPKVYHRDTLTVCKKDGTPVEQAPQDERTDADHTSDEE